VAIAGILAPVARTPPDDTPTLLVYARTAIDEKAAVAPTVRAASMSLFQQLTQRLQAAAVELRQFIQQEHSLVIVSHVG
jgi:hypothetical protein